MRFTSQSAGALVSGGGHVRRPPVLAALALLLWLLVGVGPADATFPGSNGRIAFTRQVTLACPPYTCAASEIFVANPDGTGAASLTTVTAPGTSDYSPRWSPDGTKLAFVHCDSVTCTISVMNADGSGSTSLAEGSEPVWSPDGRKIAFLGGSPAPGTTDLYAMNADGSGVAKLFTVGMPASRFDWSPDGTRFVFAGKPRKAFGYRLRLSPDLFLVNVDGSGLSRLTSADRTASTDPSWSPDGTRIAYVRQDYPLYNGDVHVMSADGTGDVSLTADALIPDASPRWSPDATKILWMSGCNRAAAGADCSGTPQMWVMDSDGSAVRQLLAGSGDSSPDWQPGAAAPPPAPLTTNVHVSTAISTYDPSAFGRRLTFALGVGVGTAAGGGCQANAVTLTDTLPPGVRFVSESYGGAIYEPAANTVTWRFGDLRSCLSANLLLSVAVDPSVSDGATLTNRAEISTSTPETRIDDNVASVDFVAGFLPLKVTVLPSVSTCRARADGSPLDEKSVRTLDPVRCSANGVGSAAALTQRLVTTGLSPDAGVLSGTIANGTDVIAINGLGVRGEAYGFSNDHGSASASAERSADVQVFNPNPYPVRLRVIRDVSAYAAAGNENAVPPFPGRASVDVGLGNATINAGQGVATDSFVAHLDSCGADCGFLSVEDEWSWPAAAGSGPALNPVVSSFHDVVDTRHPAAVCSDGPVVDPRTTLVYPRFGVGTEGQGRGDTSTTATDAGPLLRSGYGVFSASASMRLMRCDASPAGGVGAVRIVGNSPIDLVVTDPDGKRLGFDLARKQVVDEVFGGQYSGHGSHPQTLLIPDPAQGRYAIAVQGIGDGPYTVTISTLDQSGREIATVRHSGIATAGRTETLPATLSATGSLPDTIAPTTEAAVSPEPNAAGWNRQDTTVTLNAVDDPFGSGVKEVVYSSVGAQPIASTTRAGDSISIPITTEGVTTISYFARDAAGNAETPKTVTVRIDKTAPEALVQFDPSTKDIAVLGRDELSGVRGVTLVSSAPAAFDQGEGANAELRAYRVTDVAGNTLVVVEKVKKRARELGARTVALRYNGFERGVQANELGLDWKLGSDGTLRKLEQSVQIGESDPQQNVEAKFDAKRDRTVIKIEEPKPKQTIVRPGLVLLGVGTHAGVLAIEH